MKYRPHWVAGHWRNGYWVDGHWRTNGIRNEKMELNIENKGNCYLTECFWCGGNVFFVRNENGGCFLSDNLGYPWALHPCWLENKGGKVDEDMSQGVESNLYSKIIKAKTLLYKELKGGDELFDVDFDESTVGLSGFIVGQKTKTQSIVLGDGEGSHSFEVRLFYSNGGVYKIMLEGGMSDKIIFDFYTGLTCEVITRGGVSFILAIEASQLNGDVFCIDLSKEDIVNARWVVSERKPKDTKAHSPALDVFRKVFLS